MTSAHDLDVLARAVLAHNRRGRGRRRPRGSAAALASALPSQPSGSGNGGRAWLDATPRRPCPVCGGDSWCQTARDGAVVLCKRVPSHRAKINRAGAEFYVHRLGETPRAGADVPARGSPRPGENRLAPLDTTRADADTRDRAYRAVLAALTPDADDRDALLVRGLSAEDLTANAYRSLAVEGRARLARAVVEAVGEDFALRVPGIVRGERDGRAWLSLSGSPGILVPCRDDEGRIIALKVRRREAGDGPRYLYLTSARRGGASAESALHVPVRTRAALAASSPAAARVVVTEGELKADVASVLLGLPVWSIPGVGSWRLALEAARRWRPAVVCVALDADTAGARAAAELVDALRAEGMRTEHWRWDRRFKGIDDYLAARRRGEV